MTQLPAAFIASRLSEMIMPYADAAPFMVNALRPASGYSRHRVSLALPAGMRGKKVDARAAAAAN